MAAALDDPALLQEQDLVGIHERAQPMRDDDRRPACGLAPERLADVLLGGGIDRRGRVVEHQDRRREEDAAGDRETLALTARERHAALADQGLVVLRQPRDVVVQPRHLARLGDALALGPGVAVGDVVLDRSGKEEGVLLDQADGAAQRRHRDVAHILAVDRDPASADVVVARDQMRDGRLAAARRADDPERPAGLHLEADVMEGRQCPPFAGVGEIDVLEAEPGVGHHQVASTRPIRDVRLAVEHLEEAPAGHGGAREGIDHHAQLAHRHLQDGHEGEVLGERADGDRAREHLEATDPQQQAHGEEIGVGHRGGVADPQVDTPVGEGEGLARHHIELVELIGLRGKGADYTDAAEVLLHHAREDAELFLQSEPAGAQAKARDDRSPGGEGHEAQRDQAERRLSAQQQACSDADQDDGQHEADHPGIDHRPDALDVEHAAGDQLARVHPVVEAEAQPLQLGVVRHAQVVGEPLPDRLALVVLPHREQAAQHGRAEQECRGVPEGGVGGALITAAQQALRAIDGAAEIFRDQELKDCGDDRGAERDRHAASVAERHTEHPAQNPEVGETDLAGGLQCGPRRYRTDGRHGRPEGWLANPGTATLAKDRRPALPLPGRDVPRDGRCGIHSARGF
jgi:hypothetical protein